MTLKRCLISLLVLCLLTGAYFLYMAWAFPAVRCEAAKHLNAAEMEGDCYTCHMKATARVAQEWYESKHELRMTGFGRGCSPLRPELTGALFVLVKLSNEDYLGFIFRIDDCPLE